MPSPRSIAAVTAVALAGVLAPASARAAERFYAVTDANRLVTFGSDSPGAVRRSVPIRGLEEGERIQGLDMRPADGRLYGVGESSRLVRLDPATGQATPVGDDPFSPTLRGQSVGFDFDPAGGNARVVTEDAQNQRIDPGTGQTVDGFPPTPGTQPDRDLTYARGTIAPGTQGVPRVTGLAYARTGRLYGLDTSRNLLVTQDPDAGVVTPLGPLGLDVGDATGFDVAADGRAWASLRPVGRSDVGLFTVDLARGTTARATRQNAIGTYVGGRRDAVRGLAAGGPVPDDHRAPRLSARVLRKRNAAGVLRRGRSIPVAITCNEACRATVRVTLGRRTVGTATGRVLGTAGRVVVRIKLSRAGRARVRRHRGALRLRASASDAAGNGARKTRVR